MPSERTLRRALLHAAAGLLSGLLAASPLHAQPAAQEWPVRPLRLIVPLAPGGQSDIIARALAHELSQRLPQPVVVENRPGAQNNIGMEAVARAAPDGYTYLVALTALVLNPHLQRLSFDPMRDLVPVALLARVQFVLVSSPALPVTTPDELIARARAQPGGVNCAHSGGIPQIACALFASLARVKLVQVPYGATSLALNDIARGDVHMMFENIVVAAQHARNGQIRPLAVTNAALGTEPLGALPTLADTLPGFELSGWQGIVAPAGTPTAIVRRMNAEIAAAIASPEVRRHLDQGGARPMLGTPEEFGEFLRREHARFGRIVQEAGLRPD